MLNEEFIARVRASLPPERCLLSEPMKRHTTFKIGGPADYLLSPASLNELKEMVRLLGEFDIPYVVLGNGSNVLVRDKGIRGAVINCRENFADIKAEGTKITAQAGALLKDVSAFAADCSLTGLEFAVGIPGSIGGAIFMNAGAYGGEIANVVTRVRSVDNQGGEHILTASELDLGYRHSIFQKNGQLIAEVELTLSPGHREAILAAMADLTQKRETKQPMSFPSAGSTFKRPVGYYAGTLIDQTGLKGLKIGGAQVSEKHAGFVVNCGNATADDVLALIAEVQQRVYEAHGVRLYPEVRILGEE